MSASRPVELAPQRILVITLRYLGDTLLVTPLISSLKQAYADAEIDVLLPAGNLGMLTGNPDIQRLIAMPAKPGAKEFAKLLAGLIRRYDLAISTQASDRTTLCALIAGKTSLGFVPEDNGKAWWKKWLLSGWLIFPNNHSHAVLENLRFCQLVNIAPCYRLTPPSDSSALPITPQAPYAVLHIMPQWRYKQWHTQGWQQLIAFLIDNGYQVVLTGSKQAEEWQALQDLQTLLPATVINLAGQLSLGQLSRLIGEAALFVGPDTGITHLAAATGTPTVALFGPTDPERWAPWPDSHTENHPPFASRGSRRIGNVYLIQGTSERDCLPCQLEGCEKNRNSHSDCLDSLSARQVIDIIAQIIHST